MLIKVMKTIKSSQIMIEKNCPSKVGRKSLLTKLLLIF